MCDCDDIHTMSHIIGFFPLSGLDGAVYRVYKLLTRLLSIG